MDFDRGLLLSIVKTEMPYGKYKGTLLYMLPMFYLEWMSRTGFPKNKLGRQLETVFEIKLNGLDEIFAGLKNIG